MYHNLSGGHYFNSNIKVVLSDIKCMYIICEWEKPYVSWFNIICTTWFLPKINIEMRDINILKIV